MEMIDVSRGDVFEDWPHGEEMHGEVSAGDVQPQDLGLFQKPLDSYSVVEGLLLIICVLLIAQFLGGLWRGSKWHK